MLYFGGINGFNIFDPRLITSNNNIPKIVITDFQLFNKQVEISENNETPLSKSILETKAISLNYKQNSFTFEFSSLDYLYPSKNEYAYKMEGFEKDWNYVKNRRFATYTSLPAGEYVFKVKGSNSDRVWNNEGVQLQITITPPFWETTWFRILFV